MKDKKSLVESNDWKKDCLKWRNKAKKLEHRVHELEKEKNFLKGIVRGYGPFKI